MSAEAYVVIAYAIGLGLLWGYGLYLWSLARSAAKVARIDGDADGGK